MSLFYKAVGDPDKPVPVDANVFKNVDDFKYECDTIKWTLTSEKMKLNLLHWSNEYSFYIVYAADTEMRVRRKASKCLAQEPLTFLHATFFNVKEYKKSSHQIYERKEMCEKTNLDNFVTLSVESLYVLYHFQKELKYTFEITWKMLLRFWRNNYHYLKRSTFSQSQIFQTLEVALLLKNHLRQRCIECIQPIICKYITWWERKFSIWLKETTFETRVSQK